MTYEEVKILFSKYPVASTWPSANPQALHFDTGPKGSNFASRDLHAPNRGERYVKVPFAEVASHIEKTGRSNSENIFDRLRPMAAGTTRFPSAARSAGIERIDAGGNAPRGQQGATIQLSSMTNS